MCRLFLCSFRSGSPHRQGGNRKAASPTSMRAALISAGSDECCEHDFTFQSGNAAVLEALSRGTERISRLRPLSNATTVRNLLCRAFLPEKSTAAGTHALTAALKALEWLSLWTWDLCLQEHAERAYGTVCSHGKVLSFAIEKPCRCCHFTRRAGLTVSSGTARPSIQTDSNLLAVATFPHGAQLAGK